MKKYIVLVFAALISLSSCQKSDPDPKPVPGGDIKGQWELVSMDTKSVNVGGEMLSVYLQFDATNFEIYQIMGGGRPRKYTGTYTLDKGVLTGKYSDGKKLGSSYDVSFDGGNLKMASQSAAEVDTYKRCTIPASVIADAFLQ